MPFPLFGSKKILKSQRINVFVLLFYVVCSLNANSQDLTSFHDKGIFIDLSQLDLLSHDEKMKILNYDFDRFRSIDNLSEVQLINGPEIKLESLISLSQKGINVSDSLIQKKHSDSNSKESLRYRVDVGIGRQPLDGSQEKWQTTK